MQILIISGFLGAGKTSFIKAMSKAVGRQFCIVENEFGEVGVDGPLLGSLDDLNIFELTEGCICCNPNIDFASSVLTIANTINPDYLIVEPSGVAMLDSILEQLSSICYEQIKLLALITLVDGEHFYDQAKEFKDYFQSQVENAGSLAFSKSEKFSADDFKKAIKFVKENASLQEDAEIYEQHYSLWDKEKWESLFTKFIEWEPRSEKKRQLGTELGAKKLRKSFRFVKKAKEREEAMQSIGLNELAFLTVDEMVTAMNVLVSGLLGRVVRAKGYANIKGETIRFDIVDGIYSITSCDILPDERGVVIGKNLNRQGIINLLHMADFRLDVLMKKDSEKAKFYEMELMRRQKIVKLMRDLSD